jgi:hypothetical protein
MAYRYPTPQDIGIRIPHTLRKDRFCRGFDHALRGGQLNHREYFRLSFRLGFRTAKLYLREVRRQRGILEFPMPRRWRLKAIW